MITWGIISVGLPSTFAMVKKAWLSLSDNQRVENNKHDNIQRVTLTKHAIECMCIDFQHLLLSGLPVPTLSAEPIRWTMDWTSSTCCAPWKWHCRKSTGKLSPLPTKTHCGLTRPLIAHAASLLSCASRPSQSSSWRAFSTSVPRVTLGESYCQLVCSSWRQ